MTHDAGWHCWDDSLWLTDQAVMVAGERGCYGNILPTNKIFTPIPADIAQKLGLQPR